ncbi:hypothetical protein [Streptomyces sp. NPDC018031]|uniref:hypothetical protein n=1 Tax=Streptomyces sp. NPDC018031 TaxID=3365033 RepID=UPI0037A8ED2A
MANNPHGSHGNDDPAGSTQMFRAFVDDGAQQPQRAAAGSSGGQRNGLVIGVIVAIAVLAGVAWLVLG